ncbi:MAG: prepilin peptidase [Hydrogenophaga sp.]|jgi:leader peptidase (prepilin peptidase)/N-methyltransferase|uniref:prepilin peptidase n=1 Tax=Hydrogenophaga sp. TaxID=1904254 RepID=UPI001D9B50BF|nr:A24 family peptidase [Hydrogenophaga sp.]MBW0170703.1 A24 family peptidase [Hydrogenophaga sp.]MBW0185540.1 A24 family peptidase [Hydrogenophaga sp.]
MPETGAPSAALLGLLGLLVGSFLNVVIHRLPRMMELRWAAECAELQTETAPCAEELKTAEPYNLMVPRSRCPHCGHQIRWFENIPVLSYVALKGQCSQCATRIGARYPIIEVITALLFAWCGWNWGLGWEALAWCGFSASVLALACIDWDTTLLPDDITLPLLWAGLCAAGLRLTDTPLPDALWGAVAGYVSLWLVYWAFKLVTGKEGMGYGDFKLFAALGAWFGWQALIPVILMASLIGAVVGIAIKLKGRLREGGYVPFGPFLALAGLTSMVFGPSAILTAIGL